MKKTYKEQLIDIDRLIEKEKEKLGNRGSDAIIAKYEAKRKQLKNLC